MTPSGIGYGQWLFACGHESHRCQCAQHVSDTPHYLTDLCAECRAKITQPPTLTDATPLPVEPFPKATD